MLANDIAAMLKQVYNRKPSILFVNNLITRFINKNYKLEFQNTLVNDDTEGANLVNLIRNSFATAG